MTAKLLDSCASRSPGARRWLALALTLTALTASAAKRPNIVWLVSEDNSPNWLRLYDPHGAAMPQVERLAEHGIVFNHAFSCAPVCSVARSTIISGCYAPRLGVQYHRKEAAVPMPAGLHMFPYYLRRAGYYTTNCAKEDYNFSPADKDGVWDASSKKASYRNRSPGQPFFHVQNYGATHEGSLHFPPKAMNEPTTTDPASVHLFPYHPDTPTFRYTYARYLDRHVQMDTAIGKFIQGLEDQGLMEDTFIFYYGDHGGVLPRGKGYIYESGLQVPMVVYVPKNWEHLAPAPAGSRIDGFVQFVDLSATVLRLAGITPPDGIDGTPFLGEGVGLNALNRRDTTFGYADRFDEKYDLVRSLRKGRFKYMRSYQPFNFDGLYNNYRYQMLAYQEWWGLYRAGKLNPVQRQFFEPRPPECLYDLDTDPYEIHNLAGDSAHAKTLAELRTLLQQQVKSMPDLSFYPEPVFLAEGGDNPAAFGQQKKAEIARLVDTADLSLRPFPDAQAAIARALDSDNPWERYWGLIVCSSFGKQAAAFYDQAKTLAAADDHRLVRVRAAEFLGLTGAADPRPILLDALHHTSDPVEASLVLNTAALLQDSPPGYTFTLDQQILSAPWATDPRHEAHRRIAYLQGESAPRGVGDMPEQP